MSVLSVNIPGNLGISVSESPAGIPAPGKPPNESDGYKVSMPSSDTVWKCLDPISENARNKIWMCPELSIFSNSEYVCAIFPIPIALFWEKGGREICLSRPLSLLFIILSHCLNTKDVNNYSVRKTGKWSCGDAVLKGSAPLAHLDDFGKYANGSKPRIVGGNIPKTPHQSSVALVLATLRFKRMSTDEVQGRENLAAIEFIESELVKRAPNP